MEGIYNYTGTLFWNGMNDAISDTGLQFIPTAGRKEKKASKGTEEDEVMEEAKTMPCSAAEILQYASNECLEEEEEEDYGDDDEIVEGLNGHRPTIPHNLMLFHSHGRR